MARVMRKINSYALFIIKVYKNPRLLAELRKLSVPARFRFIAKKYIALAEADRATLVQEAAKIRQAAPKPMPKPKLRSPSVYNVFVKKNFETVTGTGPQRLKKLAKLWNSQKKKA